MNGIQIRRWKKAGVLAVLALLLTICIPALSETETRALRQRYPGWTLRLTEKDGQDVTAVWTRFVNGLMYARRESFHGSGSTVKEWMPVPVTDAFMDRMRAGEIDALLSFEDAKLLILSPEGLDMARLSCEGTAVWAALYPEELVLLTDERLICICRRNEYGYFLAQKTAPLGEDVRLDADHCADGKLSFVCDDGCGAVYLRNQEGGWRLKLVQSGSAAVYQAEEWGILDLSTFQTQSSDGAVFGVFPWLDLFTSSISTLPRTFDEASYRVDRSGWAVVCNPRATESLNLRAMPDETSRTLGKFYNRTPVEVLTWQGNWSLVRIGGDMEGWMQTKYLYFGRQMDDVRCAFPLIPDEMQQHFLQSRNSMGLDLVGVPVFWYIGARGDYALIMNSSRELYSIPRKAVD